MPKILENAASSQGRFTLTVDCTWRILAPSQLTGGAGSVPDAEMVQSPCSRVPSSCSSCCLRWAQTGAAAVPPDVRHFPSAHMSWQGTAPPHRPFPRKSWASVPWGWPGGSSRALAVHSTPSSAPSLLNLLVISVLPPASEPAAAGRFCCCHSHTENESYRTLPMGLFIPWRGNGLHANIPGKA